MKIFSTQIRSTSLHLYLFLLFLLSIVFVHQCLSSNTNARIYLIPSFSSFQHAANCTDCRHILTIEKAKPIFRLFIGVLTLPSRFERRSLIRLAYSAQSINNEAHLDIRFIVCNITKEEEKTMILLENMHYDDIIMLNCTESMNSGKTYTYFSSLPKLFSGQEKYDYAMKSDDDTYLRLDNLVKSLKDKARHDMYYGAGFPLNERFPAFMLGMAYVLSWDLVEWIAESEIPRHEPKGPEDVLTGNWLKMGNKAKNRYNMIPIMYDYRGSEVEDFIPGTIAVHQLKETTRWLHTLKYFNVTNAQAQVEQS